MKTKVPDRPISERDLCHSIKACHRIEDAIWRRLWRLDCTEASNSDAVAGALFVISGECPEWCDQAAWNAISDSFLRWSTIFGNLQLFAELRRKRDEQ